MVPVQYTIGGSRQLTCPLVLHMAFHFHSCLTEDFGRDSLLVHVSVHAGTLVGVSVDVK